MQEKIVVEDAELAPHEQVMAKHMAEHIGINVRGMRGFKKFLASPGAALLGLDHNRKDELPDDFFNAFFSARTVAHVGHGAFQFTSGAWMPLKEKEWTFLGNKAERRFRDLTRRPVLVEFALQRVL